MTVSNFIQSFLIVVGAVTRVSWIYRDDSDTPMCVSASQDETLRIWSLASDMRAAQWLPFIFLGPCSSVVCLCAEDT